MCNNLHHNFRLIPNRKKINPLFRKTKLLYIYTSKNTYDKISKIFLDQYSGDIKLSQRRSILVRIQRPEEVREFVGTCELSGRGV